MIIFPEVTSEAIKCIVIQLEQYEKNIKNEFNISDIQYFKLFEHAVDNEGYGQPEVNARIIPNEDYTGIDKMIICSDNIAQHINTKFRHIYNCDVLDKIIEIYIKYIIIHELVHIKQIKMKLLTKEVYRENREIDHDKREYEIQANEKAREIISLEGTFEKEIANIIFNNQSLDNNESKFLIDLFNESN